MPDLASVLSGSRRWCVAHGDSLTLLRSFPEASVDVVITDPPAGIGFMGKPWDSFATYEPATREGERRHQTLLLLGLKTWEAGFVAFLADVWAEVDRVLKPGGFCCAWALPKTADLAGLAMRLTGWTIHESVLHLFGSGMNKAGCIGKQIDKAAGAERDVLGENPNTKGRTRPNGCVAAPTQADDHITAPATEDAKRWTGWHSQIAPGHEQWLIARKAIEGCTPQALHETTGWDYYWSQRNLKTVTTEQQAKLLETWPELAATFDAENKAHEAAITAWKVAIVRADESVAAATSNLAEHDSESEVYERAREAHETARNEASDLRASPPKRPVWARWSGRSLRPEHCGIVQLRRDGEVIAEREGAKFSKSKIKTVAAQLLTQGCGAFNVDACRVPRGESDKYKGRVEGHGRGVASPTGWGGKVAEPHPSGSHPSNVILTPGGDGCPVEGLDRQSGVLTTGNIRPYEQRNTEGYSGGMPAIRTATYDGDSGGASRYFTRFDQRVGYFPKASDRSIPGRSDIRNEHPTHKHPALMYWLCKLMGARAEHMGDLPAVVLDPFNGSGTTGVAAMLAGLRYIGLEQDEGHVRVAHSRIQEAADNPSYYDKALKRGKYAKRKKAENV